jgi:hypothetical protein
MQQAVVDIPALKLLYMKDVLTYRYIPIPCEIFQISHSICLMWSVCGLITQFAWGSRNQHLRWLRTAGEHNHVVDMSALPAGTYLIRWQYDSPSDPLTQYVKVVRLK